MQAALPSCDALVAYFLCGLTPGRVEYLVAVSEVSLERPLGHEHPLAFVLHQDLARGLEEAPRGTFGGEFGLLAGRCAGVYLTLVRDRVAVVSIRVRIARYVTSPIRRCQTKWVPIGRAAQTS